MKEGLIQMIEKLDNDYAVEYLYTFVKLFVKKYC